MTDSPVQMTDSPTATPKTAPRPRVLRTAAGVVAQYIHDLSERHGEASPAGAVPISGPRASQAGAAC